MRVQIVACARAETRCSDLGLTLEEATLGSDLRARETADVARDGGGASHLKYGLARRLLAHGCGCWLRTLVMLTVERSPGAELFIHLPGRRGHPVGGLADQPN